MYSFFRFLVFIFCGIAFSACVPEEVSVLMNVEELVEERFADPKKKAAALEKAAEDIKGFAAISHAYKMCPAKSFGKQRRWFEKQMSKAFGEAEYDAQVCSLVPELCVMACKDTEPEACFNLGRAFEDSKNEDVASVSRRVFAYSCVVGSASGCTNRGAGMRNSPVESDPASKMTEASRQQCQFELFKVGCENGYSWGCTMLAQAYLHGEGVSADKDLATVQLKKACADPENGGCPMARDLAKNNTLGSIENTSAASTETVNE